MAIQLGHGDVADHQLDRRVLIDAQPGRFTIRLFDQVVVLRQVLFERRPDHTGVIDDENSGLSGGQVIFGQHRVSVAGCETARLYAKRLATVAR